MNEDRELRELKRTLARYDALIATCHTKAEVMLGVARRHGIKAGKLRQRIAELEARDGD